MVQKSRDGLRAAPLTEPDTVSDHFITGAEIEPADGIVRFVAYVEPPNVGGQLYERRTVSRLTMTNETWRTIVTTSRKKLARGGDGHNR